MTTTNLPPAPPAPPAAPVGGAPTPGAPPRRTSSRVVATIAIVVGSILLLGTVFTGVVSIIRSATTHTSTVTASAAGLAAIDLDVSAAEVTVEYGEVAEPTLRVTSGRGDWRFERVGDTLVVSSDRQWWGRWGWGWLRDADSATLTLPRGVEGLDADFDVDGGSLTAQGGFGDLGLTLDAGSLRVTGRAETVSTDVNAGSARLELGDVTSATVSVSAGSLEGRLGDTLGNASPVVPRSLSVDVSAGRVDLTVPDAEYAITSDVSAGSFSHDLSESSASDNRIGVTVSAGAVILRSAG